MTEDEFKLAMQKDKEGGIASEVILGDGATTRVRSFDGPRQVVVCDRGKEVPLSRLERSGSMFFERNGRSRVTTVGSYKGR